MPSIIPTFEYDIFISYRHNDNRSGWVTDFVNALREELAATIKEPLSIYFDQNLHDGLLETHNVDKSLEGKLKCLIFIPIISQTYCDRKSFAWQHEFVAFNKLVKGDEFGRDVKLGNGNVSSRILPIKIHDLDLEDKATIENEIGGVLRAIEFIYKSPGVNRPLTMADNPEKNSNKTFYKDQLNKVANAVKEIITAIKNPDTQTSPIFVNNLPPSVSSRNRKPIFISIALLLVLIGGYVLYQRSSTNNAPSKEVDKSIAVLPFADMSPSRDQEYFGDGMAEEIINVLAQAEDLKVIARTSSFQFKGKNEDLRTIGSKLGVSTILEGSVRKSENLLRNTAQLINTEDGTHLWSKTFDRQPADIFKVQDEIAKAVATALKATLTTGVATQTKMAWNEEAQKEYQLGWKYFAHGDVIDYEIAYPHFKKSVMLDSTTAIAYPFLYFLSNNSGLEPNPKKYLDRALALSPQLPEARIYYSFWHMGQFDFVRAQDEMNKALKFGPRNAIVLRSACRVKTVLGKHEEAIKLGEEAVAVDPLLYFSYISLSIAYERAGKYQQAIENIKKARGINRRTDDLLVINYVLNNQMKDAIDENKKEKGDLHDFHEILIQVKLKQVVKANQLLDAFSKKGGDGLHFWRCALASAYSGNNDQAFEWLEKCFQSKEINLTWVKDHPLLKNLEADPRFKAFLKKLNFPED